MKDYYIVYITVNKINNKIYVGVHKTNTPNKFDGYLGNGVWVRKNGGKLLDTNTPFQKAINKYGYDNFTRHTLFIVDNAEKAFELEEGIVTQEFINYSKTYNASIGGRGGGIEYKLKRIHAYKPNGDYALSFSSGADAVKFLVANNITDDENIIWDNITSCIKNFVEDVYGYIWSFKEKKHLRKRKIIIQKMVYQYSLDGKFLNAFASTAQAARSMNLQSNASNTIGKCASGKYSKAYGFLWSYTLEEELKNKADKVVNQKKQVSKYTKHGEFIATYDSLGDAISSLDKTAFRTPISLCMKGERKTAYGFVWR